MSFHCLLGYNVVYSVEKGVILERGRVGFRFQGLRDHTRKNKNQTRIFVYPTLARVPFLKLATLIEPYSAGLVRSVLEACCLLDLLIVISQS